MIVMLSRHRVPAMVIHRRAAVGVRFNSVAMNARVRHIRTRRMHVLGRQHRQCHVQRYAQGNGESGRPQGDHWR